MANEQSIVPPHALKAAVLFLVFKRLNTTKQVFAAIQRAKPPRLYIAADGPRTACEGETEKVQAVRDYLVSNIDWPCKVKTLFRDENLGCRYAISGAITWFFDNEEEGIILEDDCLPHPDFFKYCDWALYNYRDDKSVWHINGNNFECVDGLFESSLISFTSLAQVWGWATWRDRWISYQGNPFYLMDHQAQYGTYNWLLSPVAKINKIKHIRSLQHGLDAWDYQWQVTVLNYRGLCVSCRSNLISNLGDGVDATHTQKDRRTRLKVRTISGQLEYLQPSLNKRLTHWYEKKMALRRTTSAALWLTKSLLNELRLKTKSMLAKHFFKDFKPIVVAGTGRNGSTLLFTAISESLVYDRFKIKSSTLIGRSILRFSRTYTDRLSSVPSSQIPVHKTHDVLSPKNVQDARFIFVYGNPFEAAQSVQTMVAKHGKIWLDEHQYHLKASGSYEELYERDILNYEEQMLSWLAIPNKNVFGIRYEQIWDRKDELQRFLGFKVILPERKARKSKPKIEKYNVKLFKHLTSIMNNYDLTGR